MPRRGVVRAAAFAAAFAAAAAVLWHAQRSVWGFDFLAPRDWAALGRMFAAAPGAPAVPAGLVASVPAALAAGLLLSCALLRVEAAGRLLHLAAASAAAILAALLLRFLQGWFWNFDFLDPAHWWKLAKVIRSGRLPFWEFLITFPAAALAVALSWRLGAPRLDAFLDRRAAAAFTQRRQGRQGRQAAAGPGQRQLEGANAPAAGEQDREAGGPQSEVSTGTAAHSPLAGAVQAIYDSAGEAAPELDTPEGAEEVRRFLVERIEATPGDDARAGSAAAQLQGVPQDEVPAGTAADSPLAGAVQAIYDSAGQECPNLETPEGAEEARRFLVERIEATPGDDARAGSAAAQLQGVPQDEVSTGTTPDEVTAADGAGEEPGWPPSSTLVAARLRAAGYHSWENPGGAPGFAALGLRLGKATNQLVLVYVFDRPGAWKVEEQRWVELGGGYPQPSPIQDAAAHVNEFRAVHGTALRNLGVEQRVLLALRGGTLEDGLPALMEALEAKEMELAGLGDRNDGVPLIDAVLGRLVRAVGGEAEDPAIENYVAWRIAEEAAPSKRGDER